VVEYHKRWVARWPTVQVGPPPLPRLCSFGVRGTDSRRVLARRQHPKVCLTLIVKGMRLHRPPRKRMPCPHRRWRRPPGRRSTRCGQVRSSRAVRCPHGVRSAAHPASHARTLAAPRPAEACRLHVYANPGPCAAPVRLPARPATAAPPAGREPRGRWRAARARQARRGRRRRPRVLPARRVPAGRGAPRGGALRRRAARHRARAAAHPRCGLSAFLVRPQRGGARLCAWGRCSLMSAAPGGSGGVIGGPAALLASSPPGRV